MDIEVHPGVWMNLLGSEDRDDVDFARHHINQLFEANDAAIPMGETYDETNGEGDRIFKLIFFCKEKPDITQPPTSTQRVLTTLSGIFSNAGFSVSIDEYGMQVVVQQTQDDIMRFQSLSYEIRDGAHAQDLQNFEAEFAPVF